jgi:hypothetical protein
MPQGARRHPQGRRPPVPPPGAHGRGAQRRQQHEPQDALQQRDAAVQQPDQDRGIDQVGQRHQRREPGHAGKETGAQLSRIAVERLVGLELALPGGDECREEGRRAHARVASGWCFLMVPRADVGAALCSHIGPAGNYLMQSRC